MPDQCFSLKKSFIQTCQYNFSNTEFNNKLEGFKGSRIQGVKWKSNPPLPPFFKGGLGGFLNFRLQVLFLANLWKKHYLCF
ncbi:MAG: hypothetical protein A2042_01385 [Candidatus Schekmanbacteria bacterium GWA2_38_11]|uniref:Uncharacterized protein n=1 Tax=Candidatus Schekmanbacteria bacterium GWA2_38_11 TaxID=1817876 RepID=A0A1F7RAV2_9BACT|nr:MAG: hypothetical protein A2042_01385 [Candidatus Schekmanbacteria bacterium GWA2_38_11]